MQLGLGPQDLEGDPWDDHVLGPDAKRRRTDEATALVAVIHDLAVLHFDPRLEEVRLAETIGVA